MKLIEITILIAILTYTESLKKEARKIRSNDVKSKVKAESHCKFLFLKQQKKKKTTTKLTILSKIILSKIILSKIILSKIILSKIILSKIILSKIILK